ncbi:MAG: PadR family transcriptional regulator [Solirubrobacteraceae bacterium]
MANRSRRLSRNAVDVLSEFLSTPSVPRYGLELMKAVGLGGGTLYPILQRFEDEGWVEAHWEDADPRSEGRPRRRYYQLTALGQTIARDEARRATSQLLRVNWGHA